MVLCMSSLINLCHFLSLDILKFALKGLWGIWNSLFKWILGLIEYGLRILIVGSILKYYFSVFIFQIQTLMDLFLSRICSSGLPILLLKCLKMILFRSLDIMNRINILISNKNKLIFLISMQEKIKKITKLLSKKLEK